MLFLKEEGNDPQCVSTGFNQYGPQSAVDGDYFSYVHTSADPAYTVFQDYGETRHWWRVDLESSQNIAIVRVWARTGCQVCKDDNRMLNFEVLVGNSAVLSENSICASGLPDPYVLIDIQCPPGTVGRYVFLALPEGIAKPFNFAEVEVFQENFNLARACAGTACATVMDSVYMPGESSRGNDGDYDNHFHTLLELQTGESAHWWRVDLESSQNIGIVRVHNRRDCAGCVDRVADFSVHVGDSETLADNPTCASNIPAPQLISDRASFADVECNATRGRYVFVSLPKAEWFHLAEVEVFAAGFSSTTVPTLSGRCVLSIDDCRAGITPLILTYPVIGLCAHKLE